MEKEKHTIKFYPSGRGKAQSPPDPNYPEGVNLDGSEPDRPSCEINMPYPAPECGMFVITCNKCGLIMAVTAAGRVDDPRSVSISCKELVN